MEQEILPDEEQQEQQENLEAAEEPQPLLLSSPSQTSLFEEPVLDDSTESDAGENAVKRTPNLLR